MPVEPRRIDLAALLNAHAFMRVERPPELWEVDVLDEPFIRMLGELIVVGLRHHDVLGELTLNVSNAAVGDDGPDGVGPGDYVALTIRGPGDWTRDVTWTPTSAEPLWSRDLDAAARAADVSFAYLRRLGDDEGSITVFVPRSRRAPNRRRLPAPPGRSMAGMAVTSTMMPLGTRSPDFALPDVTSGRTVSLADFDDRGALLVMFLCRHCPYVKHVRSEVAALAREHLDSDLGIVAISANDPETYPDDAPESLAAEAIEAGYTFPYLFDETQEVAKAFTAACTPDFFLFDRDRALVYRGQFDSSRPSNGVPVTGEDLRGAIDALLSGRPISEDQRPSIGCGIKWRPGNEPAFG